MRAPAFALLCLWTFACSSSEPTAAPDAVAEPDAVVEPDAVAEPDAVVDAVPDTRPDPDAPDSAPSSDVADAESAGDLVGRSPDADVAVDIELSDTVFDAQGDSASDSGPVDCESTGLFEVTPALETAGYRSVQTVSDVSVTYRAAGGSWIDAHPPAQIADGSWVGALFWLSPGQSYEVAFESDAGADCVAFETLPVDPPHETLQTVEVGPGESISDAVAAASPGTDIVIKAGVYHEEVDLGGVAGEAGRYIRILGEPGAILDGSPPLSPSWTQYSDLVWQTDFSGVISYLARDGVRMYHFASLSDLSNGIGDDGVAIDEGWVVEGGQLYVRSYSDPGGQEWQIPDPELDGAFLLDAASWIWIEGLEIRFYGAGQYPRGIDIRGSSHVVVRNNLIHNVSSAIWARKGGTDLRVSGNTIHQSGVDQWPWAAIKGTDHENSAISVANDGRAVVHDNIIHTIFNGIGTGSFGDQSNTQLANEVDVYRNRMRRIYDDGLEPEGACINNRFWDNSVDEVLNGISLAPISPQGGPVWVLNNRFTAYTQSGFKVSNNSTGPVFLYHNTCWTDVPEQNGMGVSGPFTAMRFRNNIIRGTRYAVEMTYTGISGNDLDVNNWFTTRGAPWVKWNDTKHDSLADWCAADGLECNGYDHAPALADPAAGLFAPASDSPNVDAGVLLPGINHDFQGEAPDLGYREAGASEPPLVP